MKNTIFTIAAFLLFASAAFAQGSIEGTITDAKGKGVANVSVTVVGADGKAVANVKTDEDGYYTFDEIAAGKYKVTAQGPSGYKPAFRDDIMIEDGDANTVDITLVAAVQAPAQKPAAKPATATAQSPMPKPTAKPEPPVSQLDDIISKHIDALGGREKLLSLKTVRMTGTLVIQGTDIAVTLTISHLIGSRLDFTTMGTANYRIVTPTKATNFIPVQGMNKPEELTAEELKAGQPGLDMQGPLLDYRAKGTSVELLGTEKVDGVDHFKLKLTFKSGVVSTYFISTKTYLITKTLRRVTINGEVVDVGTTYSNYKKNADGYLFAYTFAGVRGETNYDKIETNVAVDPAIFK